MNSRAFTLSLIIAGIAMFMVYSYIDSTEAEFVKKYGNPQPVVVAKVDIKELELIDDTKVQVVNVPEKFRMPGHIKKVEEIYNTIATVPIQAGEQITKPRVTHPGARTGLANQISVGKRAYAVNVTSNQAASKLIKPGDRVDLISLVNYAPGQLDKIKVKTVLQDVLVLSTGFNITNALPMVAIERDQELKKLNLNTYTDYNTVTLELTPAEIQQLIFLTTSGATIHLSLRNNDDKSIERLPATELFDVLGEDAVEAKEYYQQKTGGQRQRAGY
jgi:pilus assembly protein CpaB